jgi:hypothetical protein
METPTTVSWDAVGQMQAVSAPALVKRAAWGEAHAVSRSAHVNHSVVRVHLDRLTAARVPALPLKNDIASTPSMEIILALCFMVSSMSVSSKQAVAFLVFGLIGQ